MSPALHSEHSWKQRQWSAKERCRNVRILVVLVPLSELMFDKSMWVMSAISLKSSASTKRPHLSRFTAPWLCSRRILLIIRIISPVNVPVRSNPNIRGSSVSGLICPKEVCIYPSIDDLFTNHIPLSDLMSDRSIWVMFAISVRSLASSKHPQRSNSTAFTPCLRRMSLIRRIISPVKIPAKQNICRSSVSVLVQNAGAIGV